MKGLPRPPIPVRAHRPGGLFRPQLEALEDRCLPDGVPIAAFSLTAPVTALTTNFGAAGLNDTADVFDPATEQDAGSTQTSAAAPPPAPVQVANVHTDPLIGVRMHPASVDGGGGAFTNILVSFGAAGRVLPESDGGARPQVVAAAAVPQDGAGVRALESFAAAGTRAQLVSLNAPAGPAPQTVGGFLTSSPVAPETPEATVFVTAAGSGQLQPPPDAGGHAPPPGPVSCPPLPGTASLPAPSAVPDPFAAAGVRTDGAAPAAPAQVSPIQVGVAVPWPATVSPSLGNLLLQLGAGNGTVAGSAAEKESGLPATAAQRKAMALGLRYLYPDMTDDEIAQTAGVSRRTLFRWEEYTTLKKALRDVYRRPRGFKTREGNLEAWDEEDE
jgi:hypothetical protein